MKPGRIQFIQPETISLTREVAFEFFDESGISGVMNFDHFSNAWSELIRLDLGVIMVYIGDDNIVQGVIGGTCVPCTMTGDLLAQESFWFVRQKFRGSFAAYKLLIAFELWAKAKKAKRIIMCHLTNLYAETLENLFKRRGYDAIQVHYIKEL